MKVVVTGATGFIGTKVCEALAARGDAVIALTRGLGSSGAKRLSVVRGVELVEWSPVPGVRGAWWDAVDGAHAVVHLAGEPIGGRRWTEEQKRRIRESRVDGTRALLDAIAAARARPSSLVSTSAVGYYGFRGDETLDESASPGDDFLAQVCREWEAAALEAEKLGLRVAIARIGIVLGEQGGALSRMLTPFRLGVGGPIGTGEQWMSWVHLDDVVALYLFLLDHTELRGAVNAVAPEPVRNRDLARAIGHVLRRPSWLPVPRLALRLGLGEFAEAIVEGQRVVPAVATRAGFRFRFESLEPALRDILRATA